MINLLLILLMSATPFPAPEQVRAKIAVKNSLREAKVEMYKSGKLQPPEELQRILEDFRSDVLLSFASKTCASGYMHIPYFFYFDIGASSLEIIYPIIRRELDEAGWKITKWEVCSPGWRVATYRYLIEPKDKKK